MEDKEVINAITKISKLLITVLIIATLVLGAINILPNLLFGKTSSDTVNTLVVETNDSSKLTTEISPHKNVKIIGFIRDGDTQKGIPYARIHFNSSIDDIEVTCDASGEYNALLTIEEERIDFTIQAKKYGPKQDNFIIHGDRGIISKSFILSKLQSNAVSKKKKGSDSGKGDRNIIINDKGTYIEKIETATFNK